MSNDPFQVRQTTAKAPVAIATVNGPAAHQKSAVRIRSGAQGIRKAVEIEMIRNPKSHRHTEANAIRTQQRIDEYLGVKALLATWEMQPSQVQFRYENDISRLRDPDCGKCQVICCTERTRKLMSESGG